MNLTLIQRPSVPVRHCVLLAYLLAQNLFTYVLEAELFINVFEGFVLLLYVKNFAEGFWKAKKVGNPFNIIFYCMTQD